MWRNFTVFIYLLLVISVECRHMRSVSIQEQGRLDKAHRNDECCKKKMRCCVKKVSPPIEIRAVILRCPNLSTNVAMRGTVSRNIDKPIMAANAINLKSFQGFDEDEPLVQSRVTDCRSKVVISLRLNHRGAIDCSTQYIVVDHVYDPVTEKPARLLNPYVIRLKQDPVARSFHLKFVDYVNSEAREEVHNKQEANYTGCYISKYRSTCGQVKVDGRVIPYSEGFCCSCDSKKNRERQPDSYNEHNEEIISYSDPGYLLDRVACPRSGLETEDNTETKLDDNKTVNQRRIEVKSNEGAIRNEDQERRKQRWKYTTYSGGSHDNMASTTYRPSYLKRINGEGPHDYLNNMARGTNARRISLKDAKKLHERALRLDPLDETRELFVQRLARKMRQIFPSGVQRRGGQNCADRFTPPNIDPEHYHESAHCLRFSDVWYGIYKLGEPSIEQSLSLNIYERFETVGKTEHWREVTNDTIHLSDRVCHYEDETPTISVTYGSKSLGDPDKFEHWESKRILIPEGARDCESKKYPEMRGGPEEYLVVPATRIALEGDQCDRIGVGFEGFYKQPQRCSLPRGTCLHNQPKHLWRNDKSLDQKHKRGCYFLKYHANMTSNPLYVNATDGEKYLYVQYSGKHTSNLDIEIKADMNTVIRGLGNAAITEVYVDSTCGKFTSLIIKIINTGLVSSKFSVQLADFPVELPEKFNKIRSRQALIAPQAMHIFTLEIRTELPSNLMYCSVEVLNIKKELVALRRVRIQKFDRCICAWYCLCACVASVTGLNCKAMSLEHYHAAGFEGSLPIVTYLVHFTLLDDLLSVAFYFVLFLLGVLLILGVFKAVLGLCCPPLGLWGLPVILDLPKPMSKYYEARLRKERVVYDDQGWPVDPKTRERTRNIAVATEFCANVVFFFTYPLACTIMIFRRLCCPYSTTSCLNEECLREDKCPMNVPGATKVCEKLGNAKPKRKESDSKEDKNKIKKKTKRRTKSVEDEEYTPSSDDTSKVPYNKKKRETLTVGYTMSKFRMPDFPAFDSDLNDVYPKTSSLQLLMTSEATSLNSKGSSKRRKDAVVPQDNELNTLSEISTNYSRSENAKPPHETETRIPKPYPSNFKLRSRKKRDSSATDDSYDGSVTTEHKSILRSESPSIFPRGSSKTSIALSTESRSSIPTSSTLATLSSLNTTHDVQPLEDEEVPVVVEKRTQEPHSSEAGSSDQQTKSRPRSF